MMLSPQLDAVAAARRELLNRGPRCSVERAGYWETFVEKIHSAGGDRHAFGLRHRRHRRAGRGYHHHRRSEEHTSELQSLMRISYAVFCLKKKTTYPPRQESLSRLQHTNRHN